MLTAAIQKYLSPLRIRCVRFHCEVEKALDIQIPQLRGTWGLALNQMNKQIYNIVFEGISPLKPTGQKNPKYIIRHDLNCSREKSKTFSFEFLTWNVTDEQYKTLLTAWNIAATYGLGKGRIPFKIEKAEPFSSSPVKADVHELTFPHSVRLIKKGELLTELTFYDIILAVLYRLAPVIAEANGKIPSANPKDDWIPEYQQIIDSAKEVKSIWHGEKQILCRYSARQQREVKQEGVYGIMQVENVSAGLLPLLDIAGTLHIGKATIMGLGQIQCTYF